MKAADVRSLGALFFHHVDQFRFDPLLQGEGVSYSTDRFKGAVFALAGFFQSHGLKPGDRVAVLSENRPEWHVADFALHVSGLISVPLYTAFSPSQVRYVLEHSGAVALAVSTPALWAAVAPALRDLPELRLIVLFEGEVPGAASLSAIEAGGPPGSGFEAALRRRAAEADERGLATIVYTSGTTGLPKGVMLSHSNLLSNLSACLGRLHLAAPAQALSILPLAHVLERLLCYGYFVEGVPVAYGDPNKVAELAPRYRPEVMGVVPRILERVREKVLEQMEGMNPRRRAIGRWLLRQGLDYGAPWLHGTRPAAGARLAYPLVQALLFSKLHQKLGGRLRFLVCGGAKLDPAVESFFHAAGFRLLQGYGLTEAAPVVTLSPPGAIKIGSVGRPLDGLDVRFDEEGELWVRGPNVMMGYYKDAAQTAEALDPGGWLRTGDLAVLDPDGYLAITGRKKEILVTSGGKNVCPAPLEHELCKSPLIRHILLVGDGRKFISALVVPDYARVCRQMGIAQTGGDPDSDARVEAAVWAEVEGLQSGFAAWERVRQIRLLADSALDDPELLTPTQKLRRRRVEEKYRELIESMYSPQRHPRE